MKQYRGTDEPRRGYHVIESHGAAVIDRPVEEDEVIEGVTHPLKYRIAELGALLAQFVGHDPAPEGICLYCRADRSHEAGCLWLKPKKPYAKSSLVDDALAESYDVPVDELVDYCLRGALGARPLASDDAVRRLVTLIMAGVRTPT